MLSSPKQDSCRNDELARDALQRYWGYDTFRPLQQEAIRGVLAGRDSLVVLPTGGGKSLCFQVPAVCLPGLALVVSPLISLMKDQVDSLRNNGIPAACVHSGVSFAERRAIANQIRRGELKILYISPERLANERTRRFLADVQVSLVAIDEAHCISAWGHDFRPEYRELRVLRELLPGVAVHAYTATATPRVRTDIAEQLTLRQPGVLIGPFDRPNLVYKVQRRAAGLTQLCEVLSRHPNESGIVYCITRKDVDETCQMLVSRGHRAIPYHAGLDDDRRRNAQDAFMEGRSDVIVATIAFGMGIDKPDVRFVVHQGMPKSLENYQQESGRAGRDGLEAECCLLFSGRDYHTWQRIIGDAEPTSREGALESLNRTWNFCNGVVCRHRGLVEHFGQQLERPNCEACDVCLGELDQVEDPTTIGQKILSCVVRLGQAYGGDYTAKILVGSSDATVLDRGHQDLSTWGILKSESKRAVRDWIEQLVGQGFLSKSGDYQLLQVTRSGRALLRGEAQPKLLRPAESKRKRAPAPNLRSWEGVDRNLFERLRQLRNAEAADRQLPPYMIFDDVALREMARHRPTTLAEFHRIRGVGEKKLANFGEKFTQLIADDGQSPSTT